jgi:FkbM family methyltransferase
MDTATKILLASAASRVVRFARRLGGRTQRGVFTRRGVRWELDLAQGIDFSIWLLGCFEPATLRAHEREIKPGQTVLDIGANIGAHTLHFARLVGAQGTVVAFEPTAFAFAKLTRNRALNPELTADLRLEQLMLVAADGQPPAASIYSSWPLESRPGAHALHRGELETTAGAGASTLDQAVERLQLGAVDHIKLDVDGNEPEVIAGGMRTLARFRPTMTMELAPCLYAGSDRLDATLRALAGLGYRLYDERSLRELPGALSELTSRISGAGSINVIARAR